MFRKVVHLTQGIDEYKYTLKLVLKPTVYLPSRLE